MSNRDEVIPVFVFRRQSRAQLQARSSRTGDAPLIYVCFDSTSKRTPSRLARPRNLWSPERLKTADEKWRPGYLSALSQQLDTAETCISHLLRLGAPQREDSSGPERNAVETKAITNQRAQCVCVCVEHHRGDTLGSSYCIFIGAALNVGQVLGFLRDPY